jgi:serine/threonine-protein kinase
VSAALRPGDVLDGVYVIERLLGKGGMGAVYVAREERLGRRVAIKVLLDTVAGNPEAVKRFEREGRSAAALQSDHVTRVLSVGSLPGGAPFIVMELLEGEDLATVLGARGRLAVTEVIGYITQVCEALAEAHALGIVHRDLKPANIFIARRPTGATTVKVLDFGISKGATGAAPQSLTATTAFIGTPYYMSPEQVREAKAVDARSDVWALGIVMYELLTGRPPFVADVLADLCVLIVNAQPPPVSSYRPDVTPALDAILSRCLEKEPAHRYRTVKELMVALSLVASPSAPALAPSAPALGGAPRAGAAPMSPQSTPTILTDRASEPRPAHGTVPLDRASEPRPAHGTVPLERASEPRLAHGTVPLARGSEPRLAHGTVPLARGSEPRAFQAHAATVDPVSHTQAWGAPSPPRLIGLAVFAAALATGSVVLFFVLRTPSELAAATSGTPDAAEADAATAATASASAHAGKPAARTPPATVLLPPSTTSATTPAREGVRLPAPPASPVALPAPALPAPALPAPAASPAPSARPIKPATEPGALMPGTRN